MIPFALLPALLAGSVYINGVRADLMPEVSISNATVRFDGQGNVWIDAPGYRVQVVQPAEYAAAAPVAPAASPGVPVKADAVQTGAWWLVTEDNGSSGYRIEVLVNGVLVRRIASGEPQLILDVGPYLRRGANTVVVASFSASSDAPPPASGALTVYLGRGNNLSGTIRLDNPDIVYTRRASETGARREYTLTIP